VFELVRWNMERAAQKQARHYNLRRREWSPKIGDTVWAKEHHLSKSVEGFAATLAPRYDGPYTVMNFLSPGIAVLRHVGTKKEKRAHVSELKAQRNTKKELHEQTDKGIRRRPTT
ncbi:hypothetical protein KR067_010473, partial [Drosophila pandora]